MNPIAIQCANCGAKYKLPETFTAAKAKCKACGNQIDVAAARSAAPPAAAAAPAPAPVTRPAAAEKPTPSAKAAAAPARERSAHASSRRAGKEAAAEETGTGRKSRSGRGEGKHHAPKKNNQMLLFAGIGGAVLVGAVLWFVLGGDKQAPAGPSPKVAQEPAKTQEPPKPADEPKADPEPAAQTPPDKPAAKPADKPAPAPAEKPVTATEKPQEAAAQKPEKPKPAPAKKLTSKDEVYNPAKELQPLTYEDSVTDDQKKEVEDLVASIVEGGMPGIRAKKSVVKIGHRALPAIINRLREVNYLDSSQAMTAWELNKLLEEMALGVNAGYRQVMDGEAEDLDKSDWNAKTVKQWQNFYNVQYPTAEKWKELIAKRKNRNVEDSKKPDDGDKG